VLKPISVRRESPNAKFEGASIRIFDDNQPRILVGILALWKGWLQAVLSPKRTSMAG
jgi:hypothetical protein